MERTPTTPEIKPAEQCPHCDGLAFVRNGRDRDGAQRYRCKNCGRTFGDPKPAHPLHPMRIPTDRALLCLSLLVEGSSIRSIERVTGTHRDTVCRLLVLVGGKCADVLDELIADVEVEDVQADEIWQFVQCKEKHKKRNNISDPHRGDAWGWTAIERHSKLILAHHLGRRTFGDCADFIEKLGHATTGQFQLTTDGHDAYRDAIETDWSLGERTDFAMLIKIYGEQTPEDQRRYSPATIIGTETVHVLGTPDPDRICTSHVERANLTHRMSMRRLTRLTNGFSKKWENLKAAWALHVAHYNLCRLHSSIRCTPAMAAGVTSTIWSLRDLIGA